MSTWRIEGRRPGDEYDFMLFDSDREQLEERLLRKREAQREPFVRLALIERRPDGSDVVHKTTRSDSP